MASIRTLKGGTSKSIYVKVKKITFVRPVQTRGLCKARQPRDWVWATLCFFHPFAIYLKYFFEDNWKWVKLMPSNTHYILVASMALFLSKFSVFKTIKDDMGKMNELTCVLKHQGSTWVSFAGSLNSYMTASTNQVTGEEFYKQA